MAVEIAQLVLRGSFGPDQTPKPEAPPAAPAAIQRLRRELLAEMREMIDDALRQQYER
ncbi:MAG: DUF5908 family protein [Paracoccus sp. (in: a-proteobacteria)]